MHAWIASGNIAMNVVGNGVLMTTPNARIATDNFQMPTVEETAITRGN